MVSTEEDQNDDNAPLDQQAQPDQQAASDTAAEPQDASVSRLSSALRDPTFTAGVARLAQTNYAKSQANVAALQQRAQAGGAASDSDLQQLMQQRAEAQKWANIFNIVSGALSQVRGMVRPPLTAAEAQFNRETALKGRELIGKTLEGMATQPTDALKEMQGLQSQRGTMLETQARTAQTLQQTGFQAEPHDPNGPLAQAMGGKLNPAQLNPAQMEQFNQLRKSGAEATDAEVKMQMAQASMDPNSRISNDKRIALVRAGLAKAGELDDLNAAQMEGWEKAKSGALAERKEVREAIAAPLANQKTKVEIEKLGHEPIPAEETTKFVDQAEGVKALARIRTAFENVKLTDPRSVMAYNTVVESNAPAIAKAEGRQNPGADKEIIKTLPKFWTPKEEANMAFEQRSGAIQGAITGRSQIIHAEGMLPPTTPTTPKPKAEGAAQKPFDWDKESVPIGGK